MAPIFIPPTLSSRCPTYAPNPPQPTLPTPVDKFSRQRNGHHVPFHRPRLAHPHGNGLRLLGRRRSGCRRRQHYLFSTVSGVLADRLNRKYLVLFTLVIQGLVAASLGFLISAEKIQLWHILLASTIDGGMMSIRVPSRMALIMDIAGRRNIQNATAANFAAMTGTGIIIPPLAGRLIESHGIEWAYFSMSAAFALSTIILICLSGVRSAERSVVSSPFKTSKKASGMYSARRRSGSLSCLCSPRRYSAGRTRP